MVKNGQSAPVPRQERGAGHGTPAQTGRLDRMPPTPPLPAAGARSYPGRRRQRGATRPASAASHHNGNTAWKREAWMASDDDPALVLGPLLRYAGETEATIWVETNRPCQVEVLGHAARTFAVAGHHYGLVVVTGLRPGTEYPYRVALDGTVRWPQPDSAVGPSVIRTLDASGPQRLVFGSCRVAELPPLPRRNRVRREHERGSDAMAAFARTLAGQPPQSWPHAMLLIGDQVYSDNTGPATRRFIASRRDPREPPGYQVADFEEYCALYREAWSEPAVRWLLSVIPTIMIFDDHDVHNNWYTSATWRREFQSTPWWQSRLSGAYLSYWIYQHL